MEFMEKLKGFFIQPQKSFKEVKNEKYKDYLVYFGILALIPSIVGALIGRSFTFLGPALTNSEAILLFILTYVMLWITTFVGGAWLHIWIKLFGGKADIDKTFKALVYGDTPYYLLGWIPFISIIFVIWSWILGIIGLSEYHKIEWWKVFIAEIIAGVIFFGAIVGIAFLFGVALLLKFIIS